MPIVALGPVTTMVARQHAVTSELTLTPVRATRSVAPTIVSTAVAPAKRANLAARTVIHVLQLLIAVKVQIVLPKTHFPYVSLFLLALKLATFAA